MAAGLGFKDFTTGEVLTAADVDGYLMQGIWVFASEAARNAAVTSPQEGNFAFTKDNNSLWYYDGAAWVASGATGDIEGVTAGVGISGGGTSGTVTITNSMATAIDAKGDLVVGTGADTFSRLAVGGTNGHVLTVDSGEATGMKWAAAGGGGGETWTTWTPTMTGLTQGNGTLVARYIQVGKVVDFFLGFTFGSTSSITGLNFTLPVTPSRTRFPIFGLAEDTGTNSYPLYAEVASGTAYCQSMNAAGTYVNGGGFSGTVPFTWGNTDAFYYSGSYEVA